MKTVEVSRDADALLALLDQREAKHIQELAEAQAGVRAVVSREAAARFLGMSTKTLYRIIQKGEGPPFVKRSVGSRSQNERVYFPYPQLNAWKEAQTQYSSPDQRQKLREEAERARLRAELANLEAQAAALRRALRESGDLRIMAFEGLTSLTEPHPWVMGPSRVLGHALIVSDQDLEEGDLIWLSLEEALAEDWADLAAHGQLTEIYAAVLEEAAQLATNNHKRKRLALIAEQAKTDTRGPIRDL